MTGEHDFDVDLTAARIRSVLHGEASQPELMALRESTPSQISVSFWRILSRVLDLIVDYEHTYGAGTFQEACRRAAEYTEESEYSDVLPGGFRLLELTYLLLESRFRGKDWSTAHGVVSRCEDLVRSRGTGQALREVYGTTDQAEQRYWDNIDFQDLHFHRAGTTSFILRGEIKGTDDVGFPQFVAVKCVLFPWNGMASVSKATDEYVTNYGGGDLRFPGVVQALSSSPSWIIMEFQQGPTLAEQLASRIFEDPVDRVNAARETAKMLTDALDRLARDTCFEEIESGRQHLDLSPSNIILADEKSEVRFIDLGVNHLYSRQLGMAEHDDSVYVAPEVKNRSHDIRLADVYSLGVILTEILVGEPPREGRVPPRVWELSPVLARSLDDLLELDPTKRLVLPSRSTAPTSYTSLGSELDRTFARALTDRLLSARGRGRIWSRLAPTSREVANQWSQFRASRRLGEVAQFDTYLLAFSVLATACWWFIAAKTALFKLDDLITGEIDELPRGEALAADLIAFSQGLVAAKYYQSILSRLTTRGLGARGWTTEIVVRYMSVVALSTTMLAVFWQPSMWAWSCAAGAILVSLANFLTLYVGNQELKKAYGELSSAGQGDSAANRGYEQWWWTMMLYAVVIIVIAIGLELGFLQDEGAYVFGLVLITVGIHYLAKLVIAGPAVRGGLAHAFAVGERHRIIESELSANPPSTSTAR